MNSNFTDRVRKVLSMAREEATRLRHDYVGTEHILLGLIREGEGVAAAILTNLNVDLEELRRRIEERVESGKSDMTADEVPYTTRAKKVLEFSVAEARSLKHSLRGDGALAAGAAAGGEGRSGAGAGGGRRHDRRGAATRPSAC